MDSARGEPVATVGDHGVTLVVTVTLVTVVTVARGERVPDPCARRGLVPGPERVPGVHKWVESSYAVRQMRSTGNGPFMPD